MSSPGPLGPLSERSIPTTPHRNIYSVSTWVSIWAPYHDTTLFQKEMTYPKGRDPHNLAAYSCFDHFRGVRSWRSLVHKATLCVTKPCFGSTDDQSNNHKDKWSNKWSYPNDQPMIITQQHSACHITRLGNIADNLQLHNLWARTSQRRVLS